jgi:hypothetical protein
MRIDTSASVDHCGTCSSSFSFANGTARCDDDRCVLAACIQGFADCDTNASNGCEPPLGTATNCFGCGNA